MEIRPITPSAAHDRAYHRDAGHDGMQSQFLEFLRARPIRVIPANAIVHRVVEGEMPILRRGQIVAYADAAEILTVNLLTTVTLFEIKPRIHTVFGVVRQAKALLNLARASIPADLHIVHVIVPSHDSRLGEMRREWPNTWGWGAKYAA
jgi:hypothetical protein